MRKLFSLMLVVLGAAALVSCSKDDDDDVLREGEGVITFVTKAKSFTLDNNNELWVVTFNEGEKITIDWGDGNKEEYVSVKEEEDEEDGIYYEIEAEHTYAGKSSHTVTVRGKIKWFYVSSCEVTSIDVTKCPALEDLGCENNQLASLDVSGCTALEYLNCAYNQLISLDVSKNTALEDLDCGGNQFSASALNQIFNDLPKGKSWIDEYGDKEQSTISIYGNPGSQTCNRSIAEKKGWDVW